MVHDKLLATLNETRREMVELRNHRMGHLQDCNEALNRGRSNLQISRNREQGAVHADEEVNAAVQTLRDRSCSRSWID